MIMQVEVGVNKFSPVAFGQNVYTFDFLGITS